MSRPKVFDKVSYMKTYHRKWYQSNKKQLLKAMKQYATEHEEEITQYKKEWYQQNKEHLKEKSRLRHRSTPIEKKRERNLKVNYGITLSEYAVMNEQQKGLCNICKVKDKERLYVDHCHKTKKVRGLLCRKCNFAIGLFQENVAYLKSAIRYLKETR